MFLRSSNNLLRAARKLIAKTSTNVSAFDTSSRRNRADYAAESGTCCCFRDAATTECAARKLKCGFVTPRPNTCVCRNQTQLRDEDVYGYYLNEINNRRNCHTPCCLINHDELYYCPSNKCRRYQRTWAECPHLMTCPVPVCCNDCEYYAPAARRCFPYQCPLTPTELFNYKMALYCAGRVCMPCCTVGRCPPCCKKPRKQENCCRMLSPFPSFSECIHDELPAATATECNCHNYKPSICEMWREFNRLGERLRDCTEC